MFRSWQPLQTLSFFLFSSKLSSEYKRIFVGPFLEYEFIFQGFLALKSDKFRQISTFERRGCKSSLTGGDAYPSNLPKTCYQAPRKQASKENCRDVQQRQSSNQAATETCNQASPAELQAGTQGELRI